MKRLTHERANGIKSGHWSAEKKEALIARLAEYENTGKTPEEIRGFEDIARKMAERVVELSNSLARRSGRISGYRSKWQFQQIVGTRCWLQFLGAMKTKFLKTHYSWHSTLGLMDG